MDFTELLNNLPQYIQYIYPGSILIYLYYYYKDIDLKETNGFVIKAISVSYILVILTNFILVLIKLILLKLNILLCLYETLTPENVHQIKLLMQNLFLIIFSLLGSLLAYRINDSDYIKNFFLSNKISKDISINEFEMISKNRPNNHGIWCTLSIPDNINYSGWFVKFETKDSSNRKFISLSKYRKYILKEDGTKEYLCNNDNNPKAKIIIYLDSIISFEYEYRENNHL